MTIFNYMLIILFYLLERNSSQSCMQFLTYADFNQSPTALLTIVLNGRDQVCLTENKKFQDKIPSKVQCRAPYGLQIISVTQDRISFKYGSPQGSVNAQIQGFCKDKVCSYYSIYQGCSVQHILQKRMMNTAFQYGNFDRSWFIIETSTRASEDETTYNNYITWLNSIPENSRGVELIRLIDRMNYVRINGGASGDPFESLTDFYNSENRETNAADVLVDLIQNFGRNAVATTLQRIMNRANMDLPDLNFASGSEANNLILNQVIAAYRDAGIDDKVTFNDIVFNIETLMKIK